MLILGLTFGSWIYCPFRDDGAVPPGVDRPDLYRQRSGGVTISRHIDVWEATKELREAFHGVTA